MQGGKLGCFNQGVPSGWFPLGLFGYQAASVNFFRESFKRQQAAAATATGLAYAMLCSFLGKIEAAWDAWLQNKPSGNVPEGVSCLVVYIPWF